MTKPSALLTSKAKAAYIDEMVSKAANNGQICSTYRKLLEEDKGWVLPASPKTVVQTFNIWMLCKDTKEAKETWPVKWGKTPRSIPMFVKVLHGILTACFKAGKANMDEPLPLPKWAESVEKAQKKEDPKAPSKVQAMPVAVVAPVPDTANVVAPVPEFEEDEAPSKFWPPLPSIAEVISAIKGNKYSQEDLQALQNALQTALQTDIA